MKIRSGGDLAFDLLNHAFVLLVMFSALFPFLNVIAVSFSSTAAVMANRVVLLPVEPTLDTYRMVFKNPYIGTAYRNTVLYTVLFVITSLVVTTMAAYPLSKKRLRFRRQVLFYIVFTMIFHGGLIPSYLVVKELGLLNSIWAVIIPYSFTVYSCMLLRTYFEQIPVELEEAAKIDGMGDLGIMLKIYLPLSVPIYATLVLLYAINQWNSFFPALLYLNDRDKYPLQMILRDIVLMGNMESYRLRDDLGQIPVMQSLKAGTIIVVVLPIICVYPFLQKYFIKGMMIGSIKG